MCATKLRPQSVRTSGLGRLLVFVAGFGVSQFLQITKFTVKQTKLDVDDTLEDRATAAVNMHSKSAMLGHVMRYAIGQTDRGIATGWTSWGGHVHPTFARGRS